ncbi:MAG TPA: ACT domain-containing protein [Methanothermococcus okinawensis]|uniref:ACT domain-containing protein n=1 Tax=Methanothermococcus okinawensis TaxID=155863 RepID=A0A833A014_9EURY|nr:ACT domain-containing protein [Methanothermococcus okinawensis]
MILLDLELKDSPGELLKALTPISEMGINIHSVIHLREKKSDGKVPVRIVLEDLDEETLERIVERLEESGIVVTKVNNKVRKMDVDVVVIGHVVDTDIRDTIDRLNKYGLVVDLDLTMPHPFKESSARMRIVVDSKNLEDLCREMEKLSKEKDLLFIKSF